MSEPLEPSMTNTVAGVLMTVIATLLGFIYKLSGKKETPEQPSGTVTVPAAASAVDVEFKSIDRRLFSLEQDVKHLENKVDEVSLNVARALGELGSIASATRGSTNGRQR